MIGKKMDGKEKEARKEGKEGGKEGGKQISAFQTA